MRARTPLSNWLPVEFNTTFAKLDSNPLISPVIASFITAIFCLAFIFSAIVFSMSPSLLIVYITASQSNLGIDDVPKFAVTVSNPMAHAITILTWNSPLDSKAAVSGIFKAVEVGDPSQKIIEGHKIMFRRVTPPPRTDLIEIPSGGDVNTEVELPGFPLEAGKSYKIRVEGRWMSAWSAGKDDVTDEMLEAFGSTDEMIGVFCSNEETISKV